MYQTPVDPTWPTENLTLFYEPYKDLIDHLEKNPSERAAPALLSVPWHEAKHFAKAVLYAGCALNLLTTMYR